MLICQCYTPQNFKKIAIIYKSLYIISNKLYNKLSGGHLWQIL